MKTKDKNNVFSSEDTDKAHNDYYDTSEHVREGKGDGNIKTITADTGHIKKKNLFSPAEMEIHEVADYFGTDVRKGLTKKKVNVAMKKYGKNRVFSEFSRTFSDAVKNQLFGISMPLFVGSCVVVFAFRLDYMYLLLAGICIFIMLINAFIEAAASNVFEKNFAASSLKSTILRHGSIFVVDYRNIVPGDIILLRSGNIVPCDIRLIEANKLTALETPLTGAFESVPKNPFTVTNGKIKIASNMVYAGTIISGGTAWGIACFTGNKVQYRKRVREKNPDNLPLLLRYTVQLGKKLSVASFASCFFFMVFGAIVGRDFIDMYMLSLITCAAALGDTCASLSVAAMGIGLKRILKKGAVVNNLNCINSACKINTIMCGKNSAFPITVCEARVIYSGNKQYQITEENSSKISEMLGYSLICSEVKKLSGSKASKKINKLGYTGKKVDLALIKACNDISFDFESFKDSIFNVEIDNAKSDQLYRVLGIRSDNEKILIMRGEPEAVISLCVAYENEGEQYKLDSSSKRWFLGQAEELALNNHTVVAIAYCPTASDSLADPIVDRGLMLMGLIGIYTAYDLNASKTVHQCNAAGIETLLLTDDPQHSAVAMAKNSCVIDSEMQVLTADSLRWMDKGLYIATLSEYKLFIGLSLAQWTEVLEEKKKKNHHVAITAETLNELSLMKKADLSIVQSNENSDTLRQSSDIIIKGGIDVISNVLKQCRSIVKNIYNICERVVMVYSTLFFALAITLIINFIIPFRIQDVLFGGIVPSFLVLLPIMFSPPPRSILTAKMDYVGNSPHLSDVISPLLIGLLNSICLIIVEVIGHKTGNENVIYTMTTLALLFLVLLYGCMGSLKRCVTTTNYFKNIAFYVSVIMIAGIACLLLLTPFGASLGYVMPDMIQLVCSFAIPAIFFGFVQMLLWVNAKYGEWLD